jgi:hypothetical protein
VRQRESEPIVPRAFVRDARAVDEVDATARDGVVQPSGRRRAPFDREARCVDADGRPALIVAPRDDDDARIALESRADEREATARAIVDARGRASARTRRDGDVPVDREVFLGEMRASRRVARGARRARARATGRTRDRASTRGGARDGGRERRER